VPKLNFPRFDGENPRLWISHCESYFEMCPLELDRWIKLATMHFQGASSHWLMSVELKLKTYSWPQFCALLTDRFRKQHHELLIRQLFHIRQQGRVSEYVELFAKLVDQLVAYGHTKDHLYYTMCFIDGLCEDIKPIVLLQCPGDLHISSFLALLQEDVVEPVASMISRSWNLVII
jgi:hypothetical protein